jgi:fatty-acyl-CoA synthase
LHTQDIGHLDAEGYLQVTDRIKDVIKTGGEWVSSLQIEDIARHPAVAETAVIGVQDGKWGERPVALVVLKKDVAAVSEEDIRQHVMAAAEAGTISRYGVPDRAVCS